MLQISPSSVQTLTGIYATVLGAIITTVGAVLAVQQWIIKPVLRQIKQEREERLRTQKDIEDQLHRLATIMQTFYGYADKISQLEVKMAVFWGIFEKGAADMLHRDDTPEIDVLLEKLQQEVLTTEETEMLFQKAAEIESDMQRPRADRVAAIMLRAVLAVRLVDT